MKFVKYWESDLKSFDNETCYYDLLPDEVGQDENGIVPNYKRFARLPITFYNANYDIESMNYIYMREDNATPILPKFIGVMIED